MCSNYYEASWFSDNPGNPVKDLHHDHLVRFVGACVDPDMPYLLTEYCPRGSLQDILEDDDLQLDGNFKHSLIHDIVKVRVGEISITFCEQGLSGMGCRSKRCHRWNPKTNLCNTVKS